MVKPLAERLWERFETVEPLAERLWERPEPSEPLRATPRRPWRILGDLPGELHPLGDALVVNGGSHEQELQRIASVVRPVSGEGAESDGVAARS